MTWLLLCPISVILKASHEHAGFQCKLADFSLVSFATSLIRLPREAWGGVWTEDLHVCLNPWAIFLSDVTACVAGARGSEFSTHAQTKQT